MTPTFLSTKALTNGDSKPLQGSPTATVSAKENKWITVPKNLFGEERILVINDTDENLSMDIKLHVDLLFATPRVTVTSQTTKKIEVIEMPGMAVLMYKDKLEEAAKDTSRPSNLNRISQKA